VCVTPLEMIDRAHAIAAEAGRRDLLLVGDMLRVTGTNGDLLRQEGRG